MNNKPRENKGLLLCYCLRGTNATEIGGHQRAGILWRTVLLGELLDIGQWGMVAEVPWPENAVSITPLELWVTCLTIHGTLLYPPCLYSKSVSSKSYDWHSQEKEGWRRRSSSWPSPLPFPLLGMYFFRLLTKWSWWPSQMPCNQTRLQTPGKLKWILMHVGNIRDDSRKLGNCEKNWKSLTY